MKNEHFSVVWPVLPPEFLHISAGILPKLQKTDLQIILNYSKVLSGWILAAHTIVRLQKFSRTNRISFQNIKTLLFKDCCHGEKACFSLMFSNSFSSIQIHSPQIQKSQSSNGPGEEATWWKRTLIFESPIFGLSTPIFKSRRSSKIGLLRDS